jgi:hypothetical protein
MKQDEAATCDALMPCSLYPLLAQAWRNHISLVGDSESVGFLILLRSLLRLRLLKPLQHLAHAVVHLARKNKKKKEEEGTEADCGVSARKEGEEEARSVVVGTSMYFLTHRSAQRPSDTLSSDSPKRNTHFFQHWCCILHIEMSF